MKYHTLPLSTGAAAVYKYTPQLEKKYTVLSRYDEPFKLYRLFGDGEHKRIALPRNFCPLSKNDLRIEGPDAEFTCSVTPRNSEQTRVIKQASELSKEGTSFVVQAPTGFGKTVCAMAVIANVGKKTIVIVTKEDVRDQWIEAAKQFLGMKEDDIGLIQGDICSTTGKRFVIAMIQSISKFGRYSKSVYEDFGLVIWDEVHRVGADVFANSAWLFPAIRRIGLSATPERRDGKDILIGGHIGHVFVLTKLAVLKPKIGMWYSKWKCPQRITQNPGRMMFVHKILSKSPKRNLFIAEFLFNAWKKGRNIIVFSELLDHLKILHTMTHKNGVPIKEMSYYIGGLTKQERESAKVKKILFSTYSFTSEATDIPWLDTAVLATPRSDVIQIIGRILREYPDKKQPFVLDIVDNSSWVYAKFAEKRLNYYRSIGAQVRRKS